MTVDDRRRPRTRAQRFGVAVPLVLAWSAGLAVMAVVATQGPERSAQLLADPSGTVGLTWYSGLVSNLGILAWTVAVVSAAAGAWICGLGGRPSARRFLLTGALLSGLFLVEDLLRLHSSVVPDLTGLPKGAVEAVSALVALRWMAQYRHELRRTHRFLLVAALGALAVSIVAGLLIAPDPGELTKVLEDGAKLLGVLAWATFFVDTAVGICRSVFTDALLTWPDEAYDAAFGDGAFAADVTVLDVLPALDLPPDPASSADAGSSPINRRSDDG